MWRPLTSAYCPTPFASVVQSIAVMLSLLAPRRLLVMVLIRPPSAVVSVVLSAITVDDSSRIREARGSSGLDDRRVKFRVGRIVYLDFSRDESVIVSVPT